MKTRYFIRLSYVGTSYCGWQIQPNGPSIQDEVQKALSMVLREPVDVIGAGRTDAGVHARNFMAHFDTDKAFDPGKLCYSLNHILGKDIAVHDLFRVHPEAHARFSAELRRYEYWFVREKNPFLEKRAWHIVHPVELDLLKQLSPVLKEYNDFTSFARLHSDVKTNLCTIYGLSWNEDEEKIVFSISADRFLRNMVRAIVGTLMDVARGKLDEHGLRAIIEGKDRSLAGTSAPAHGLYLCEIRYPDWVFNVPKE